MILCKQKTKRMGYIRVGMESVRNMPLPDTGQMDPGRWATPVQVQRGA